MKHYLTTLLCSLLIPATLVVGAQDPFAAEASVDISGEAATFSIVIHIPEKHHLYAEDVKIEIPGGQELEAPEPVEKFDTAGGAVSKLFESDVTYRYSVPNPKFPLQVKVSYRGCDETTCFMPVTRIFSVAPGDSKEVTSGMMAADASTGIGANWKNLAGDFKVTGRVSGYLDRDAFEKFLDDVAAGRGMSGALEDWNRRGVFISLLLILLGGLALNLTPCVLPMIPINIAIIGAGVRAGSRRRGFALGSAYGAGIAFVYGILGLLVILTGARFGTLNSSPWFNFVIAVIFLLLSLAMFGLFNLDFNRVMQNAAQPANAGRRTLVGAFFMGGIAALLAGACVAPVVIWTLLLAADLYQRGLVLGLLLPFLLGVGMALPWPLAGAGLSVLPRPGRWMEYVKYSFGIIILAAALWYGSLGYSLAMDRSQARRAQVQGVQKAAAEREGWLTSLDEALAKSRESGKPVFIDFWATWCKNCVKMDKTTFRDEKIVSRLEEFVKVKVQAEDVASPETAAMLDYFGVSAGLPTYVILEPAVESSTTR